jgi:predicted nucleic acid-binding protein
MLAADASAISAFVKGGPGNDVDLLDATLRSGELALPPVVVTELYSDVVIAEWAEAQLQRVRLLPIGDGYWRRAGLNRQLLMAQKLKAKVADTLIAQSCIDNDIALITRDPDFRHFAKYCGLKLA